MARTQSRPTGWDLNGILLQKSTDPSKIKNTWLKKIILKQVRPQRGTGPKGQLKVSWYFKRNIPFVHWKDKFKYKSFSKSVSKLIVDKRCLRVRWSWKLRHRYLEFVLKCLKCSSNPLTDAQRRLERKSWGSWEEVGVAFLDQSNRNQI